MPDKHQESKGKEQEKKHASMAVRLSIAAHRPVAAKKTSSPRAELLDSQENYFSSSHCLYHPQLAHDRHTHFPLLSSNKLPLQKAK
jgi:hypothetical protein